MSFHNRRIPDIDRLKEIYEECADDKVFLDKVIGKANAVMGSPESMDFIEKIEEKVYPKKKTRENW